MRTARFGFYSEQRLRFCFPAEEGVLAESCRTVLNLGRKPCYRQNKPFSENFLALGTCLCSPDDEPVSRSCGRGRGIPVFSPAVWEVSRVPPDPT